MQLMMEDTQVIKYSFNQFYDNLLDITFCKIVNVVSLSLSLYKIKEEKKGNSVQKMAYHDPSLNILHMFQ